MPGLDPGIHPSLLMVVIRIAILDLLLAAPELAAAQPRDPGLPPVDPPGRWRQMTLGDATSGLPMSSRVFAPSIFAKA